jgi:hypothetical protein
MPKDATSWDAAHVDDMADKLVKEVTAVADRADTGDKNANVIMASRNWYRAMRDRLRQEYGGFADTMADVLGTTSAQTGVDSSAWDYCKYFTTLGFTLTRNVVLVNTRAFRALDEQTRNIILAAAKRAEEAVAELRSATHNCTICYDDVREAWFNPCCHSTCMRCRDTMTGTGRLSCHMCRKPVGPGVHVSARLRAGDLGDQLAEVGAARHAHITNALAEVITALVAEGGCQRIVVFGSDLAKWDTVLTLRDLVARLRPRVEVIAPQDQHRSSYAGQEDVPAFLVPDDPARKALVLGGSDARALAGLDLTGTDAVVMVGRTIGMGEMLSRVLRMGVSPAARLRVVKLSVA